MKKLNRMLVREIVKSKGQFIAATAVIFAGISLFSAFLSAYMNYKNSIYNYYEKYHFIDYYAEAQSITPQVVNRVKSLDGIANAAGRISRDVGVDIGNKKRVTLRMISLPDDHRPQINDIFIGSGGYFNNNQQKSCLVSSKFAKFYKLVVGDILNTIIDRKINQFKISGIVDSPEFVYAMKTASDLTVSAEYFGIIYVKESTAQEILGFDKSYNQLLVTFKNGTVSKPVIEKLEKILKPYGFTSGIKRKDQLSSNMVDQDFSQLQALSVMFPLMFLCTAAMIIYIMQKRIINNQRSLVGVMKALGYSDGRILWHYTLYSLLISLAGSVPGDIAGYYLGSGITRIFVQSLNVPVMNIRIYWGIEFSGILISAVFCLIAGFSSARKTLGIHPAEAMRPEVPKAGKRILIERIKPLWRNLSFSWKMIIRNIFRNNQRTLLTMLGITFTIMLFMVSLFLTDSIDYTIIRNFFEFQKQDYKITFSKYASYQDAVELDRIKGIKKSEPFVQIPAETRNGWIKQDAVLIGLDRNNETYNLEDKDKRKIEIPQNGILISDSIAGKLSLGKGDMLTLKFLDGTANGEKKYVKIAGVVYQNMGTYCYMDINELGRLTGEGRMANGAMLKISSGSDEKISGELLKMPGISTIESKMNEYRGFYDIISILFTFVVVLIVFGTVMGFAIIFNTTVINIMERRRELASLKVLGYTRMEIERNILGENLLVGIAGSIPGVLLGRIMCGILGKGVSNDTFRLEVVISWQTYFIAFLSVFIFILLAQFANRKGIYGLDMVEVLKNREG